MKTWLKAVWKFLIEPCVLAMALLVLAFCMGRLLGFVFSLGGRAKEKAPEERCALCAENGILRTYPCLVKLATGQVGQIRVEDSGGYVCFSFVTDCFAESSMDGERSTARLTIPDDGAYIAPELFCQKCRTKLTEVTTAGYVLADLYDRENIQVYAITDGAAYDIRGYTVEVSGQTVTVTKYSE